MPEYTYQLRNLLKLEKCKYNSEISININEYIEASMSSAFQFLFWDNNFFFKIKEWNTPSIDVWIYQLRNLLTVEKCKYNSEISININEYIEASMSNAFQFLFWGKHFFSK